MSLFVYGTLMFTEVWQRIGIGEFDSQPATLHGYSVFRLCDAVIPGMTQTSEHDFVAGKILQGLDEETLFELDAYESNLYKREKVQVVTGDGAQLECQAYIIPESRRHVLTDEPWDPQWFAEHELENYLCQ